MKATLVVLVLFAATAHAETIHFAATAANAILPPPTQYANEYPATNLQSWAVLAYNWGTLTTREGYVSWHLHTSTPIREAELSGSVFASMAGYAYVEASPDMAHWTTLLDTRQAVQGSLIDVSGYSNDLWLRATVYALPGSLAGVSLPLTIDGIAHAPEPSTLALCLLAILFFGMRFYLARH